jgi:hypothetical protein
MVLTCGRVEVVPEIIENLDQAYVTMRTKDIEDAT